MPIHHLSKCKSNNKTKQIGWDKFFPHDHKNADQKPLKQIGPCAKCQFREYLLKGVRDTRNRRDSGAGLQHEKDTKTVDDYGKDKGDLTT